jgi:thiol-disulfide isomerase/thioredoxin
MPTFPSFPGAIMSRSIFGSLALATLVVSLASAAPPPTLPTIDPDEYKDKKKADALAMDLEEQYPAKKRPEAIKMMVAILRGSMMGSGEGWFGPASSRYSYKWLAGHVGADEKKGIDRKAFPGDDLAFARLDRNGDGKIQASDLDWSDNNPYVQQHYMVSRIFRRMNPRGDGHLTKDDLEKFFEKAAKGKDHLTTDDLRDAWLGGMSGGFAPGDAPSTVTLLKGLYNGEVGSIHEGPAVGEAAPDFALASPDGKKTVQLKSLIGKKPVVVVLGNFTCGPFRAMYVDVENVVERYRDKAEFLMVYVREAHPTDGWAMSANASVGVAVAQPKSVEERRKVCTQFTTKLKPTIPVVVDGIDDKVGNAYSGMPARLYVIDANGKVAYKSGRGPFGFRAGEMEQALAMTFVEAIPAKKAEPKPAPKKDS